MNCYRHTRLHLPAQPHLNEWRGRLVVVVCAGQPSLHHLLEDANEAGRQVAVGGGVRSYEVMQAAERGGHDARVLVAQGLRGGR